MAKIVSGLSARKRKDLEFVLGKIRQYMPLLIGFLGNNERLLDYSRRLYDFRPPREHLERQRQCVEIINAKLHTLFTEKEISGMNLHLSDGIVASIVDHHNILNHPILVSGIIISSLYRFLEGKSDCIFVLSCGGIPFSNNFHRRGFTFHGKVLPFVTAKDRDKILHSFPKRRLEFFRAAEKSGLLGGYDRKEIDFLMDYEKKINGDGAGPSKAADFVDQLTLLNNRLFPLMFEERMRKNVPPMVYFEQEYLGMEILKKLISAGGESSFIYRALFEAPYREKALKEFEGIWGAWDSKKGVGTHFFWLVQENGEEVALECVGSELVPRKPGLRPIKLEPGEIRRLLVEKAIYPNLMLNYGIIVFYCGIKPLTGIGSLNYLTDMKAAWLRVLAGMDRTEEKLVRTIDLNGLIAAPIVTYGRDKAGRIAEKYFAEMVFDGGLSVGYLERLGAMKLGGLLRTSLISIYDIKVPAAEKRPLELTAGDLVSREFEWIK